ncbi:protocatechuate 3,4-dioxygenase subunit alpha [Corynebacterium cystitidis]|uniref:Protocatechuate 3,4-dioxygenase alpha subunit n=1 Tax=Corynebacterium cystitidis DSM 20524 TaxID=1121357 RepID=A0A1H9SPA7_9CORY|nr:protocatechuate 3,4-dioxygenase subunit alpha [Corynebacterium cystitidis]WJY83125.1 Protocatechuate 3,4-dioxygenase alpha chain [Corynebacterium cystitidis DSM 20524]SER86842.1 protocatechuate 3,4-dioxygenase alpha subunit [Corynebacterium cystitidis DSM 20524]SNV66540.1 protocatechuate 3,4-dioxygenase alpha chain [Corynebacterium cystitidis]
MIETGKHEGFRYPDTANDAPDQDHTEFGITPSQTVGPYVHIGLTLADSEVMAYPDDSTGDGNGTVEIEFTVIDGDGAPIADAMIELWQARPDGTFNTDSHDGFRGLGRAMADDNGQVTFTTLVPGGFGDEAPHINVGVFARGMLERLYTRLYFPENTEANNTDPVLHLVDEPRRSLLVAQKTDKGYSMTIHVQHPDLSLETPFFRI